MAYEDDRPLSLRMPSYFGGHLLNIPKKRIVQAFESARFVFSDASFRIL